MRITSSSVLCFTALIGFAACKDNSSPGDAASPSDLAPDSAVMTDGGADLPIADAGADLPIADAGADLAPTDAATFSTAFASSAVCSVDGWCDRSNGPLAENLRLLWGTSQNDLWASGSAGGSAVHFDGTRWTSYGLPGAAFTATGVTGTASNDVWFVGNSMASHWDGTTMTPTTTIDANASLRAIYAIGIHDVWAVGQSGIAYHYDGTFWYPKSTSQNLVAVFGVATDDVWAAGAGGVMVHWNGTSWIAIPSGITGNIYNLWGVATNDVYATSDNGVLHWNGSAWSNVHLSGNGAVFGTASNDVWVTSTAGGLYHFDGTTWSPTSLVTGTTKSLNAIWGAKNNLWILGDEGVFHTSGGNVDYSLVYAPPVAMLNDWVQGVWAAAPNNAWVIRTNDVIHWDGTAWQIVSSAPNLRAIAGLSPTDIWVGGQGSATIGHTGIQHFDGTSWTEKVLSFSFQDTVANIYAISSNDVWANGLNRDLFHWDGSNWSSVTFPASGGNGIFAMWGAASNDIWGAEGYADKILHYDGNSWGEQSTGIAAGVAAVWGAAANDVWAGGAQMIHYDGSSWSPVASGNTVQINAIWGTGSSDVYALTAEEVLHWNGSAWSKQQSGVITYAAGHAFSGSGPSDVWLTQGHVLHKP